MADYQEIEGEMWHTRYHLIFRQPDRKGVSLNNDSVRETLHRVELSLSMFNDSSTVSRVNACQTPMIVDQMFADIFRESRKIARLSHGAFDPTVAPLVELWGFGKNGGKLHPISDNPDSMRTMIEEKAEGVGIGDCILEESGMLHKKRPSTRFDFSAIAKGYACDQLARMLQRHEIEDYLIEIGGEIVAKGRNREGLPWRVMIESPSAGQDQVGESSLGIIGISGKGVATSGNYRQHRRSDAGEVGHIVDPRTGYPVTGNILSVTVIADNCMMADAVATACMVLQPEEALHLLERLPDTEGLIVCPDSTGVGIIVRTTPGFPPM